MKMYESDQQATSLALLFYDTTAHSLLATGQAPECASEFQPRWPESLVCLAMWAGSVPKAGSVLMHRRK